MDLRLNDTCCPNKPQLKDRPLISHNMAQKVESLFKLLSNATRLRMLHALTIEGEMGVNELSSKIGMKPQAVSNQLQKMMDRGVLTQRRDGLRVIYSIRDSCVIGLLEQGLCLIEDLQTDQLPGVYIRNEHSIFGDKWA